MARLHGLEGNFPARPGYGSIGRIEAKGEGVKEFNIGDRVFYAGKHASLQRFKHGENHQWAYLFPVPEDMDPVEASVGCMAQIAMTAPNVTELKLGDKVAVFGLGMVGILAAMLYRLRGAEVIGVDPVKERCELAQNMGIHTVVNVAADRQVEEIMKLTENKGAEVTVDAAGHSAVVCNCIKAAALFGQVVLVGSPRASYVTDINPAFWDIHKKGLTVKGAHMWRMPVNEQRGCSMSVEWAFKTVFELIRNRQLDVKPLISHVIKPEQAVEAYNGLENQKELYTCVVIDWR